MPLQFGALSGFRCTEFDFFWTGYAYNNRDDRQAVLELPSCSRGNFTLQFPYPVHSLPSLPCGDTRCTCTVPGNGTDGMPVRTSNPEGLAPHIPVSVCCEYNHSAGVRGRAFMRELLILEALRVNTT